MQFLKKPIFTGFMPNLLSKEVNLALSFLYPWNWKQLQTGKCGEALQEQLQKYFSIEYAILFDSGRSSLQMALKALGIQKGDEVLLQAYTCSVVSNAVIWAGATPLYVDIQDTFNMDPQDLEKKITTRSKVLIIQHTFGIPADLEALLAIAKKHNLTVIEDCAHTMGGTYKGKLLGTFGDLALLSFGADKVISCGRGGALITNDIHLAHLLQKEQSNLREVPKTKILQQLYTFILFFICKPLYTIGIGKMLLALLKYLHILSRIIEPGEKKGYRVPYYPAKLPNALACIALHQFEYREKFNQKRVEITRQYQQRIQNPAVELPDTSQNIPLLRFPLLVKNPHKLHHMAKKEGILLGDWYTSVIAPKEVDLSKMGYIPGSCPKAEKLVQESINLPTSFSIRAQDIQKIVKIVNSYVE